MKTFSDFGIDIPTGRTKGKLKLLCPKCHDRRSNKADKSLSVDLDKGVWNCHYCNWRGTLHVAERERPRREYRKPVPRPLTELSRRLVAWFNSRGISETTLKKMRIGEGTHFMPQTNAKMNTVQFNYYLNGELVNIKYRDGRKDFMLEAGAELVPYNIDGIAGTPECIITEGEMDCLSFVELGRTDCVSVPNGANANLSYLDDFIDGWFEDKSVIYIASDTDTKGCQLRDELVRRFGADRCRVLAYGDGCKDANEHLQKYGKESLEKCLQAASEPKVSGVFGLHDYERELDEIYRNGIKRGLGTGLPNLDSVITFETRRICVVTGIPGSGKSEMVDALCVQLNLIYDFKVAYFSPENMPLELHAMKIIEKLCGHRLQQQDDGTGNVIAQGEYAAAKEYMSDNFFHILPEEGYTIDNILEKARYLVRRRGIRVLVLDPFNRIENEQEGRESETQYISRILDKLTNFAQQNDLLIFLVAHPTKVKRDNGNGGVPTLYDINGSANFYNKSDFGIIVHRDRESHNTLVRVEKVKFRHLGQPGDARFRFNLVNGRYTPLLPGQTPVDDNTNLLTQKFHNMIRHPTLDITPSSGDPASFGPDLPFLPSASPSEEVPF